MQEIILTINKEITAIGGLPVPSGAIAKCVLNGVMLDPLLIGYRSEIYANQQALDDNDPVPIKGLNGVNTREMTFNFGGQCTDSDCDHVENSGTTTITYTSASIKDSLKTKLAAELGILVTDIS